MIAHQQSEDDGEAKVAAPPELHEAVARAGRVLDFCRDSVFSLPAPDKDYCWHAGQALLHVIRDQLEAARLYADEWPHRPFPAMVLVRPIYEAMLQLFHLLRPDSEEGRQALARMFWHFQAVDKCTLIEKCPGGTAAYEGKLSKHEHPRFRRCLEIAEQAEAEFTPQQARQLKRGRWNVTWTGYSIAELASELGEVPEKAPLPWYGVMSMAVHVSPGMIHWSYGPPPCEEKEYAEHPNRCSRQSTDWLNRGSIMAFLCSKVFLQTYNIELQDAGKELDKEILALSKNADDMSRDEIILQNDPTVRDLVERIVQAVHPLRIILFGSAVRDEIRSNSDFDVLVVMPDGTALNEVENTLYRSMWGFCMPVDFIATTEEELRRTAGNRNSVAHAALAEGKEIYRAA